MWLWPTCLKWKSKAIRLVSYVQDMFIGSVTHGDGGVFKARLRTGFFTGPFRSARLQSRAVETARTSPLSRTVRAAGVGTQFQGGASCLLKTC